MKIKKAHLATSLLAFAMTWAVGFHWLRDWESFSLVLACFLLYMNSICWNVKILHLCLGKLFQIVFA